MLLVCPNLHFGGTCLKAIHLYEKAFGAKVLQLLTNGDADPRDYTAKAEEKELVYHGEIEIGDTRILLSDTPDDGLLNGQSASLTIIFETAGEVKAAYGVLSKGARILSPLQSTTYSSCFVSLIDRFGIRWELMTEQTENSRFPA